LSLFSCLFSGHQHSAPSSQKGAPGFGQLDPSRISLKQLESELIFQIADLLAQCGLRDMEPVSRAAQAQFLGHSNKIAEVT
jgi:hypothetical protein